jgi:hypothetical protein
MTAISVASDESSAGDRGSAEVIFERFSSPLEAKHLEVAVDVEEELSMKVGMLATKGRMGERHVASDLRRWKQVENDTETEIQEWVGIRKSKRRGKGIWRETEGSRA